jgi:hypothetical protein
MVRSGVAVELRVGESLTWTLQRTVGGRGVGASAEWFGRDPVLLMDNGTSPMRRSTLFAVRTVWERYPFLGELSVHSQME